MSLALNSPAQISGDSAVHAVNPTLTSDTAAAWLQFDADPSNSGANTVRIGDVNITITRGTPERPGDAFMLPPVPGQTYDLTKVYYLVQTGDKLNLTYAK